MKVVIAAAGTAGHINPGLAISDKVMEEEKNSQVLFIGTKKGLENDLVPKAGYELAVVEAYGFSKNLIENIKTVRGISQAKKILVKWKPDIVIGTGGYICYPVIMAARKLGIPCMLHESNSFPGLAVKILSQKVDTTMVSFQEAKARLPKAKRTVLTGTPTKIKRIEYTKEEADAKKERMGLKPNLPLVLIFGGSQGAKKINDAAMQIVEAKKNVNYQIMWAPGPKQYDSIKLSHTENVKMVPYIYNMEEVMNLADLVVARAGAISITEIAKLRKTIYFSAAS